MTKKTTETKQMTQAQMFARVLQLRADGLSFRAIEGKMLKAFGMTEVQSGTRAFNLLKRAQAAQKADKKAAKADGKAAPVKAVVVKAGKAPQAVKAAKTSKAVKGTKSYPATPLTATEQTQKAAAV